MPRLTDRVRRVPAKLDTGADLSAIDCGEPGTIIYIRIATKFNAGSGKQIACVDRRQIYLELGDATAKDGLTGYPGEFLIRAVKNP
jgi:hypothetical protein